MKQNFQCKKYANRTQLTIYFLKNLKNAALLGTIIYVIQDYLHKQKIYNNGKNDDYEENTNKLEIKH